MRGKKKTMKKVNLEVYLDKESWHKIPIDLLEDWTIAFKIWKRKHKRSLVWRSGTPKSVNETFDRWERLAEKSLER